MKRSLRNHLLAFLCVFVYQFTSAQTWVDMMQNPDANFYETQQEFENYWANRPYEKGKGYKQFRRWEDFMAPRVFPKGDVKQANRAKDEFKNYMAQHPDLFDASRSSVWQPLGPNGAPTGGGAGRINAIRIHPTTSTTLYACSPAGGLWISTNSGTSWTTNTDQHTVIGCTDIAIDPTNTQIMYLATGDGDAGDTYSIGVLKSTDGGNTWNPSGLTWAVTQGRTISKLLINPSNTQIILAATSNGIYRTTNGGTSWSQVRTGNFKDMEFKPGDPTTVYACGTTFWRSADSGATWTQITSGVPSTSIGRLAIAVTPANSAYVYILAGNSTNSGFTGVYRSTNSGTSFTTRTTSPNLLGWSSTGSDTGGQAWYDLAIAASETNADVVVVGGVNIWRSTNGGTSFSINGHWTGTGAPYVHADIHDLVFLPGSGTTYYSGNDGGVFRTTNSGGGWSDISGNMQIAQQYELGSSTSNATLLVTGHQDNGTNKMNGTAWTEIYGGDGMQCFIDRTNNNIIVASYVYGDFKRSTNGGGSWSTITSGLTGNAAWEAPIHQDPVTASTYYCGYQNIFKSTNNGGSWSAIGTLPGTGTVVEFDVAPSNTQVIYALKSNGVYKTTNGGGSWSTITGTLPTGSAALTYVEVSPTDPNKVWVTFSGYSTGNKVFMSTNGGTSWTNYSTGLPNLPANCIVYQTGSSDAVYVGTDVGVYYRDNTLTSWQPYFTGLPNVIVRDLEIYNATGKIRAATFGRGTWEADLYSPGTNAPIADFTANNTNVCIGASVTFTDLSSYSPTSWSWDFGGGGTPNTSTQQNPVIVFNTAGTYTVTLTATNSNGSDTEIKTAYITVSPSQALPLVEGFESTSFAPTGWYINDANANSNTWQRSATVGGFGTSSASAFFDNYSVDEAGGRDELQTPIYDFSGYTSATMTFDVAYARYNATYFDSLAVLVTTDCGVTFTTAYLKGNSTLATAPDVTTGFTPTSAQWRTETVNMTPYVGNPNVMVIFQNRGHYGQAIYLDNINITGVGSASLPTADFSGSPTTLCAGQTVTYTNLSVGSPTSYSWSFPGGTPATSTATNPTITYNTAGTYSVTLTATNASGSDVETKTNYITVNALPTATAGSNSPLCTGQTLNLTTPTVAGATYSWSGPGGYTSTSQNPSRTNVTTAMAGTYTVTVTANGCSSVSSTVVVVNTTPTATATSNSPVCSGNTINLFTPTVSGASYSWSGPGGFTSTAQNPTRTGATTAMAGTYTVTVTSNGCSSVSSTVVVVNTTPTATAASNSPVCTGQTINLTTPTVAGATYAWSGPGGYSSTSQNPSRPSATTAMSGTYTVTVTANGCSAVSNTTVVVNNAPTASAGSNSPVCTGSAINLTTTTVAGATYSWTGPNGFTSTSQNPTITGVTSAMAGTYTVTVNNGCTATSNTTVTVNTSPNASATSNSPVCAGTTLTLSTPTVGGATYSWSGPGGYTSSIRNPSRTNAITAMSGTYTVTVTANGCSSTSSVVVTVNANPTTTAGSNSPICAGSTINLTATNVSGGTYSWSGPGGFTSTAQNPTRTGATTAMAGTYTVTVTANGCTGTSNVTVVVNSLPAVSASSNSPVCTGQTLNLTTPTVAGGSYSWTGPSGYTSSSQNPSRTSVTAGMAGTYTITVTDGNGCSASASTTIVINNSPNANASSNSPICAGTTLTLTTPTSSGSTFSWSGPGGFTATTRNVNRPSATVAMSGTYTVTVTGSNGCVSTSSVVVTVNTAPSTTASSNTPVCTGQTINLATTSVSGATYSWSGPGGFTSTQQNPTITNATAAMAGTYTVTVNNGCSASSNTSVVINSSPSVTANSSQGTSVCAGTSITLTGGGATSYSWNNSVVDATPFVPSSTNTYTVTGTGSNGCQGTDQITITVNALPTVVANATTTNVCDGNSVTLTGSGAISYVWDNSVVDGVSFTPTSTQTYTVTGTDNNSCQNTDQVTVNFNTLPTVVASASSNPICDGDNLILTGTGAASYSWDNSVIDGTGFVPAATTTYTVTGTDVNGCQNSDQITVTVNALPSVSYVEATDTLCLGESGIILSSGSPSGGTYSGPGVSGNTFDSNVSGEGTHQIVYSFTDSNGCTNTATSSIVVGICSGIVENNTWLNASIVPNPNTGDFIIQFPENLNSKTVIEIFNGIGQIVFVNETPQGTNQSFIKMDNVSRGVYFVRITSGDKTARLKLVID